MVNLIRFRLCLFHVAVDRSQVVHVLGARLKRNLFRGWSRLCLHAASLNAEESASATATAEARVIRARAIEREAAAALEIAESRKQAAAVEAAVVAAGATTEDEGLGGDVAEEQSGGGGGQEGGSDSAKGHLHQQRIRCACLLVRCRSINTDVWISVVGMCGALGVLIVVQTGFSRVCDST